MNKLLATVLLSVICTSTYAQLQVATAVGQLKIYDIHNKLIGLLSSPVGGNFQTTVTLKTKSTGFFNVVITNGGIYDYGGDDVDQSEAVASFTTTDCSGELFLSIKYSTKVLTNTNGTAPHYTAYVPDLTRPIQIIAQSYLKRADDGSQMCYSKGWDGSPLHDVVDTYQTKAAAIQFEPPFVIK